MPRETVEFSGYMPYLTLKGTSRAEGMGLKFGTGATFDVYRWEDTPSRHGRPNKSYGHGED